MDVIGIAVILLIVVALNKLVAIPHMNSLSKQLSEIKKSAPVSSVGVQKHWMGARAYVLLADKDGVILRGYKLDGNTSFAKFTEDKDLCEKTAKELLDRLAKNPNPSRLERAQKMAAEYLYNQFPSLEISD
mgnify:CR=1 FL=1